MELPENLIKFIFEQKWTFAKTYAETWPHEYIVQEKVDNNSYVQLANHIDTYGYESCFYKTKRIYFDYDGKVYWHMENIINRCDEQETYSIREKERRLPINK